LEKRDLRALLVIALLALATLCRAAVDDARLRQLATGDGDEKAAVVAAIVASGDPGALELFKSMADGDAQGRRRGDRRQQPPAPRARGGDGGAERCSRRTARCAQAR
jgi:hypothetical protein